MNQAQIANELEKRKADLAFGVDHRDERVTDAGVLSICEMQIKWHRERIAQLEAEKKAQAQTIKAAHIRTAEVSTRHNDCQRELEKVNENTN